MASAGDGGGAARRDLICVRGGNGFIGSWPVRLLLDRPNHRQEHAPSLLQVPDATVRDYLWWKLQYLTGEMPSHQSGLVSNSRPPPAALPTPSHPSGRWPAIHAAGASCTSRRSSYLCLPRQRSTHTSMWRSLTKQQPPYIHDGDPTMIRPVECGRAVVEETLLLFFFPDILNIAHCSFKEHHYHVIGDPLPR